MVNSCAVWTLNIVAGRGAHFIFRSIFLTQRPTSVWLPVSYTCYVRRSSHDQAFSKTSALPFSNTIDEEDFEPVSDEEYRSNHLESLELQTTNEYQNEFDSTHFPPGIQDGFFVVQHYSVPSRMEFSNNLQIPAEKVERLGLSPDNTTLPVALMMLDPEEYPSQSRARHACRKGYIIVHRGPLSLLEEGSANTVPFFDRSKCVRGTVGDRVYPGDVIAKQVRMSHGAYSPLLSYALKPSFDLPVIYEDDHVAVVNKPPGVLMYAAEGRPGRHNIRYALPYVLTPPKRSTSSILLRPICCHRLDRPTGGLVIVAKTMPALVDVSRQFKVRLVKKTYTAVLNGMSHEPGETSISSNTARELGVHVVDDEESEEKTWQFVKTILDEKEAVTVWRPLKSYPSLKASNNCVTMVELKPKTGRYHQLRRHMANLGTPIVGDTTYGNPNNEDQRWGRGLLLCSNEVTFSHPHYNTEVGRKEWEQLEKETGNTSSALHFCKDSSSVLVSLSIDLPSKFEKFLSGEEKRASYDYDVP